MQGPARSRRPSRPEPRHRWTRAPDSGRRTGRADPVRSSGLPEARSRRPPRAPPPRAAGRPRSPRPANSSACSAPAGTGPALPDARKSRRPRRFRCRSPGARVSPQRRIGRKHTVPSASGRRIALVAMAAALAAYVVLHSPLRDPVTTALGLERRTCYFCLPAVTGFTFPDSLTAGALFVLAGFAAWALSARGSWPAYDRLLVLAIAWIALVTVPAAMLGGLASLLGGTYLRPPA